MWLLIMLSPLIALLPDFIVKAYMFLYHPTPTEGFLSKKYSKKRTMIAPMNSKKMLDETGNINDVTVTDRKLQTFGPDS